MKLVKIISEIKQVRSDQFIIYQKPGYNILRFFKIGNEEFDFFSIYDFKEDNIKIGLPSTSDEFKYLIDYLINHKIEYKIKESPHTPEFMHVFIPTKYFINLK